MRKPIIGMPVTTPLNPNRNSPGKSNVFVGDSNTTVAEYYEAFTSGKVCFMKRPVAGGTETWIADNCREDKVTFYSINNHPSSGAVRYGTLQSNGTWSVQILDSSDVDLTGYATEEWVQKGYQPKGNYLTKVPDGYAKTEDIPKTPEDIGAQPAGNYALVSQIPAVPVQSVNGKTGAVQLSASDVGADPAGTASGAVSGHNTNTEAHADLRQELKALTDRLNAFFDSDDKTLDELSEIVAYITSNKALIDSITTSKVSVADIVNNLTTNVANKPLSAAQGVVLKGLIDAVSTSLSNYQTKGEYALKSELPTKLSQLSGDSTHRVVTDAEKAAWDAKSNFSGKYEDLTGKPTIPTVPANVSAFTNDAGYLTQKEKGIYYIEGTGDTAGTWLGSHPDITAYTPGLTVLYKVPVAGASPTTLNINGLGAVTVVRNATTSVSTNYPVDSIVMLTYTVDSGTAYFKQADYDANTKTSAGSSSKTGTKIYLVGATSQSSSGVTTYSNANCYIGTNNRLYSGGELVPNTDDINALIDDKLAAFPDASEVEY